MSNQNQDLFERFWKEKMGIEILEFYLELLIFHFNSVTRNCPQYSLDRDNVHHFSHKIVSSLLFPYLSKGDQLFWSY